jgi:hypothetical protein
MRRTALTGTLVVLVLGGLLAARTFLTRDRDLLTTTPQPSPLTALSLVELRGDQRACLEQIVMDERSGRVRFQVATFGRPGSPLRVTIRGRGYRASGSVAAGYPDNETVNAAVRAPGSAQVATVCIRNEGRRKIALYGSQDRTRSRATTRVDGVPVGPNVVLQFAEARPASLLAHLPVILQRLTIFRPVGEWLLWPLTILFAIGLPIGVLGAYVRSVGSVEVEDAQAEAAARRAALGRPAPPPQRPLRARHPRLAQVAAAPSAWLALIIAGVFVTAVDYTRSIVQYFVMPDELGYVKQASHFASTFLPSVPGDVWFNSYSQLWPLVMALAYGIFDAPTAFGVAHALAAAAMASAAVPAYLLASRVIDGRIGWVLAAALTVTVPWLAFSGSVMTESLAYPLFVWALLACTVAIERPSPVRDAIALGAIAAAFLTRPQLAALGVAFVVAAVLHELTFTDHGRRPRAAELTRMSGHGPLLVLVAAGLVLAAAGFFSSSVLGSYSVTTQGTLFPHGMVEQGRELLGYIALGVGVLPLALAPAWIVLELAHPRTVATRALATLSLATIVTMVAVTASFSVRFTPGIHDRYLFFIVPLLTIGTVALLFDRRPATLPLAAGAAFAAAILGTAVLGATGASIISPTYALNTVLQGRGPQIADRLGLGGLSPADLLAVGTVAAVIALALARRRWPVAPWIAWGTCAALLVISVLQTRYVLRIIKQTQAGASQAFIDGRNWLDRTAPGSGGVGSVLSFIDSDAVTTASWWDVSFWNKRIDRVWRLPGGNAYSQGFVRTASVDPRTGRMAPLDERSLLVLGQLDRRFALRGARTVGVWGPFALVRAPRPYRAKWTLEAARDDGLLPAGRRARLTLFGDGRRARRMLVRVSAATTADATGGYRLVARSASGHAWTASVPKGGRGTLRAVVRVPADGPARLRLTLRGPVSRKAPAAGVIVDGVVSRRA